MQITATPENPNGIQVELTAEEQAAFDADRESIKAELEKVKWKEDRQIQYPSIQDQLDMQYWDAVNGTTTWKDAIAQVKADNPKPE